MQTRRAFTLIELLIVVAIIAILAAIAVPNFLEAQVRSKISRAQADMRTQSVAIEAYKVDRNRYPFGYLTVRQGGVAGNATMGSLSAAERLEFSYQQITTPVAYLTQALRDPFTAGGCDFDRQGQQAAPNGFPYWYDDYMAWEGLFGSSNFGYHPSYTRMLRIYQDGYTWSMSSAGPERKTMMMWFALNGVDPANAQGHIVFAYDPSNGTVSEGFVGRTNKGEFKEVNQP